MDYGEKKMRNEPQLIKQWAALFPQFSHFPLSLLSSNALSLALLLIA